MKATALKVDDLSVWLEADGARIPLVDHISFDIAAGDATALVGESGCGKTMTAMAIMGLLPASGFSVSCGSIEINGREISGLDAGSRRAVLGRDVAMVFQQPATALDPVFTLGRQIGAVYRRHHGGSNKQVRQTVLDTLESVGFSDAEDIAAAYPHQLSGGMRQLAMIAMATVCKPAVIIADEPTTALDSSTRTLILERLKHLQELHQAAILFISHDLAVVRQICHRVMVMYCGRLLESSDCESLFSHARHPYSAGLLSCIPTISATRPAPVSSIPGQLPALADLPAGCHFAPRCGRCEDRCRESRPRLEGQNGAGVACFRPL